MKYDSCEINYCCGDKEERIFRNCLLLNLKTFEFIDGPDNIIVYEGNTFKDTIVVDVAIADIVRDLNRKGYKTLYSCQGHFDKDIFKDDNGEYHSSISAPYVMFEAGEFLDKYIDHIFRIPRRFEVEICDEAADTAEEEIELNYKSNIVDYSKKRIVIRSKLSYVYTDTEEGICFDADNLSVKRFNTYNAMDLIALTQWVDELPDLTKETTKQSKFDSESVRVYAEDIKESYNIAAKCNKEISEQMKIISDIITHIDKNLAAMKVVEEVND